MARLELDGVWSPPLKNLCVSFETGLHVVVGSESDGTAALIGLCAGVIAPQRGNVRCDGREPCSSWRLRSETASLLAEEPGSGGSVRHWQRCVRALRSGGNPAAGEPRVDADPAPHERLRDATPARRRQLALELALEHASAKLVLLHEPLAVPHETATAERASRIAGLASGAIVVVATASLAHARQLGGQIYALERGVIARRPPDAWPRSLTPGLPVALVVDCESPRRLLEALIGDPSVQLAHYDAEREPARLQLRGPDFERLCLAVSRAAGDAGVPVWSLGPASIDLAGLHGASAGLARAAFEAARAGSPRGGGRAREAPATRAPNGGGPAPTDEAGS
jgi:ABC-type branched-subunit amino acid transport system ATPase component